MRYVKKRIPVDAVPWFKVGDAPGVTAWAGPADAALDPHSEVDGTRRPRCGHAMEDHGVIETIEGDYTVCPGDWIITGVEGERYPCEPVIFAKTYEPWVEDSETAGASEDVDMDAVMEVATRRGLHAGAFHAAASALYQAEERRRGPGGQVVHGIATRHYQDALNALTAAAGAT